MGIPAHAVTLPMKITGLHHVTAIATSPQHNLDFYAGLLGLRLVKRTINFDDPGTCHFYFGDAVGTPGTILTFFPWPGARPGSRGSGEVETTAFAIPPDSVDYWLARFKAHNVSASLLPERFGEEVIHFADPDGLQLELIASASFPHGEASPGDEVRSWVTSPVPGEHAIRGLHSVAAALSSTEATAKLLTETFQYRLIQEARDRSRFAADSETGIGKWIDLLGLSAAHPARIAGGSVHHIAFRVPDQAEQNAWREKLSGLGYHVSPVMDRTYFRSIYFREPGGILFEIATDPPGFATDEPIGELGTHLCLPPWLERARPQIEENLPKIIFPPKAAK
jgi:glyoxalase family protein